MRKIIVLILFSCFWLPSILIAKPTDNLYRITLPVGTEDAAVREAAFQQAWEQELIKLSGNSQILIKNSRLKNANATNFVASYHYEAIPGAASDQLGFNLTVDFQTESLLEILKTANQPAWLSDRPPLLAWITVQDTQGTRIMSLDSHEDFLASIQNLAKQRGIPLVIPLLDLATLNQLSSQDINNNWDLVEKISTPYRHGAVFLLDLKQDTQGMWTAHAQLLIDQSTKEWTLASTDENALILQTLNMLMDNFSNHYINLLAAPDNTFFLEIKHINTLEQYAQIQTLLRPLSLITHLTPHKILPTSLLLTLQIKGDKTTLSYALNGIKQLAPLENTNAEDSLTYDFQS
jgi:hypothetical protein